MNYVQFLGFVLMLIPISTIHAMETLSQHEHTHDNSVYASKKTLSLKEATHKSIKSSPELARYRSRIMSAKGSVEQAGTWRNPELEVEAENFGGSGQFSQTESAEYTYGVSQLIELGGKIKFRKQAALASEQAVNTELVVKTLVVERDVHIAYANVLANEEALQLTVKQEKLAKKMLQTVSEHVDAAKEPEMQRSKAEVAYLSVQLRKNKLINLLEVSKNRLAALIGEESLNYSLDHGHFFELKPPNNIQHYRKKLNSSPELAQQQHIVLQHENILKLEEAKRIPDPTIGFGLRQFKESSDKAYLLKLSVPIPIFNRNKGDIAKANAELTASEAKRKQINLTLDNQLYEHWEAWQLTHNQAKQLGQKIIPSAQKAFELAREGYDRGNFPYVETLDAQRTLFEVSQDYYELLKEYHLHRAWVEQLTASSIKFAEG